MGDIQKRHHFKSDSLVEPVDVVKPSTSRYRTFVVDGSIGPPLRWRSRIRRPLAASLTGLGCQLTERPKRPWAGTAINVLSEDQLR
jgi:hypothetical protein